MGQTSGRQLPIGVVIPTLNCSREAAEHLQHASAHWLPHVQEVVMVDSESHDGTAEILQRYIEPSGRVRLRTVPPGLYAAWNEGIREISAPYTYISTIGDAITWDGLKHLMSLLAATDTASCVISPPRPVLPDGSPHHGKPWPLTRYIREHNLIDPKVLPGPHFFAECTALALGFGLNTLLGSSASNLYRTDVLQKFPFPTNADTKGDAWWSVIHGWRYPVVVTPSVVADFVVHEKSYKVHSSSQDSELTARLEACVRELLCEQFSDADRRLFNPLVDRLSQLRETSESLSVHRKRSRIPWILRPSALSLYTRRQSLRRSIRRQLVDCHRRYPAEAMDA